MSQRVLPEWSKDELEYVEPTQVVRSFGYDVFANEVSEETLGYNEQTIARVLQVDGEVAAEKITLQILMKLRIVLKTWDWKQARKWSASRKSIHFTSTKEMMFRTSMP